MNWLPIHRSQRPVEARLRRRTRGLSLLLVSALVAVLTSIPAMTFATPLAATGVLPVYTDARATGWEDWSWEPVTRNLLNGSPVHAGSASILVRYTGAWSGFKLARSQAAGPVNVAAYDVLRFWVHGGTTGNQNVVVQLVNMADQAEVKQAIRPQAGVWTRVDVPLAGLATKAVTAVEWFNNTAGAQSTFYLDDIAFVDVDAAAGSPALNVDAAAGRRAISPYIYGMHYTTEAFAAEVRLPVRRWGGNDTSRYNWQIDLSNNGYDWYFENNRPRDLSADQFVARDRRTRTRTIMTIPMAGWVAKNDPQACGFSTTIYDYQPLPYLNGVPATDEQWRPQCGTGIVAYEGAGDKRRPIFLTGNNPADTSTPVGPQFVQNWVAHLVGRFGTAAQGGVRYYNLDNEPDLWHETHPDIRPDPMTYDELRDRTIQYAAAIKRADPSAKTLGPVSFGWEGYFWSAYDMQEARKNGYKSFPDRAAHGNTPLVAWYLQQMRAYEQANGVRLLDYLDLHVYPKNGVALRDAGDAAMQAKRLRSTRSLWDPTYRDESYIGEDKHPVNMRYVRLIPRMRDWVRQNYPGTKLAITEYNWGALDHINGALAQADILGIFGREGVEIATLFDTPHGDRGGKLTPTSPGAYAFRMYRNYDGAGRGFGETGVRARSDNQDRLAVYAALRKSDGALTLMIVNKTNGALTSPVGVANFAAGAKAQVFRYSAANLRGIVRQADQSVTQTGFSATFPAASITLVVIPRAAQ